MSHRTFRHSWKSPSTSNTDAHLSLEKTSPPTLLYSLRERQTRASAKSCREAHRMGDTNIIITPQIAAIFAGLFSVALTIFGLFARAVLKRMDRDRVEMQARMDRDKAELTALIKQSDERNEKRIDQSDERNEKRSEKLEALIKQSEERTGKRIDRSDERNEKRSEKLEALIKQSEERTGKRIDRSDERNEKRSEKQEADNQQRHSETQSELRDLNSRVGRLEAPDVHDRSAGRPGSQSTQRDHDSATAPEGESDPAPDAKHFDPSMVPLVGGRSESQSSAGLARQAVPDEQQVGETDSEPSEEESPDKSR